MNIKKILFALLSITVVANPYYIYAEEITVSGNGDNSSSNVNISQNNNTQVNQSNNAEITNNVELNSNTGGNDASENTNGEVNITTGDANASSQIVNAGINQSYAEVGCCNGGTSVNISGNGSGSNNSVNYNSNVNTSVSVNNYANIYNNVNGYANTGYNNANGNTGGNVSINTGDIYATDVIKNQSINIYKAEVESGNGGSVYVKIDGNGDESDNSVNISNNNNVEIDAENSANIINNSDWELNTGGNEANGNTKGDVEIETGDIVFKSTIENKDINVGIVDIDCCDKDKGGPEKPGPDDNPPAPQNNPNPPSGGAGPTTSPDNGGAQGGKTTDILPITGGAPSLMFLGIANILMFFMGWYLRLRSGRSPNLAKLSL
jgi:hypothetical protein